MILEKNLHSIFMEHCYSRPHTWRPETHFLRPTKTLFILAKASAASPSKGRRRLSYNGNVDEEVDVDTVDEDGKVARYDVDKARFLMDECERHARFARVDEAEQEWENNVHKLNWTANQIRLFDKVVEILNAEYLARLSYKGVHNEAVIRRALIEKTVKRYRWLMSTVSWDLKLSQWLHQVLTDCTSTAYLAIYLDMLQTLKSKLPAFTDRLMFGPNQLNRVGVTSTESLFPLLKRRWDPFSSSQAQAHLAASPSKSLLSADEARGPTGLPKRLPGNAVIVVVPGGPTTSTSGKRFAKWIALLNQLAPAYPVFANIGAGGSRMTILTCLEQMFASTRAKVQEVKADHPNRNLILVGVQGAGAALALQVAQVENVMCCVCIGFGVHTAEGRRGQPDDQMMELQAPVLFVVGQCAITARQEEMEDLRERMRVETGLLMVGGADDYLRLSKKKRRAEGVTQSFVDRCVVEEIGNFASDILLSPYPPQMRQSPTHQSTAASSPSAAATAAVRNFAAAHLDHNRKRNNSNGSSLDSEPPSPVPMQQMHHQQKHTRPVGRPPGSGIKARFSNNPSNNNKWANFNQQQQQGTPTTKNSTIASTSSSSSSSLATISSTNPQQQPQQKNIPPPAYPDFPQIPTTKIAQHQQQQKIIIHQQQHNKHNSNNNDMVTGVIGTTPEKQHRSAGGGSGGSGVTKSPTVSAKLQALASRGVISHNIVNTPSGIRTIPPKSSAIKVLNNITIATPSSAAPATIPNPSNQSKPLYTFSNNPNRHQLTTKPALTTTGGTTYGSLILMPDGKLARSCGTSSVIKGLGSTPIMFPLSNTNASAASTNVASSSSSSSSAHSVQYSPARVVNASSGASCATSLNRMRPKYITSKTQLISNRITAPKTIKTIPYIQSTTLNSALPPPTNLTSQEIMDLPIIFADDDNSTNQLLSSSQTSGSPQQMTIQTSNQILTIPATSSRGKLVIVNKPNMFATQNVNILKRPATQVLQKPPGNCGGVKYAKIILSKCPPTILNDDQKNKQFPIGASLQLPTDLSIRKETNIKLEEPFDLEKELVATAVVKPSCSHVDPKMMTFIYKGDTNAEVKEHMSTCTNAEIKKMLESKDI